MVKDIVVLAGTAPHSVLALCKIAKRNKAHAYVVCVDDGFAYYNKSCLVTEAFVTTKKDLGQFWGDFFVNHSFESTPVLYPTTDAACLLIEENRQFYDERFIVCMPSHHIVTVYNDKTLAEKDAEQCGLTVPKTVIVSSINEIEEVEKKINFPIIVKPQGAIFLHEVGFKFKILEKPSQLSELKGLIKQGCKLVLQEYIPGNDEDYSFYLFYRGKDGEIHDCMGVKTQQYSGIMAVGTVKTDDALASICRKYLNKIDYYGIGGIEFKRYNGKYYFIEMSTRTEGFLAIALMSGSSLVDASYLDIVKNPKNFKPAKEGTVYIDTFFWLLKRLHEHRIGLLLKEFVCFIFNPNSHFAGLYLDLKFSVIRYWNILFRKG